TDINRVAEYILLPILKEVYNYSQLRNLNEETGNYPGIDLADDDAGVAIQVTSTRSLEKVKHTLEQFFKKRPTYEKSPVLKKRSASKKSPASEKPLAALYDKLIIYILTEKPKTKNRSQEIINTFVRNLKPKGKRFQFIACEHILDYTDV